MVFHATCILFEIGFATALCTGLRHAVVLVLSSFGYKTRVNTLRCGAGFLSTLGVGLFPAFALRKRMRGVRLGFGTHNTVVMRWCRHPDTHTA